MAPTKKKAPAKQAAPKRKTPAPPGRPGDNPESQGQGGVKLKLSVQDMNNDERAITKVISRAEEALSLNKIATAARRTGSEVRNALRRVVRAGFVKKTGKGKYVATAKGKTGFQSTRSGVQRPGRRRSVIPKGAFKPKDKDPETVQA